MPMSPQARRQFRIDRLAEGRCPIHGDGMCDGLLEGQTRCQRTLDLYLARWDAMVKDGLCPSHARKLNIKAKPGRVHCQACIDVIDTFEAEHWDERLASQREPASRSRQATRKRGYYKTAVALGNCPECGKKPAEGHVYCQECLDVFKKYGANYREERKAAAIKPLDNGLPVSAETL